MITMVRNLDDLGRIVIPKEIRTQLDLVSGTPIEIIGVEDGVLLRKKQREPLADQVRRLREEAYLRAAPDQVIDQLDQLLDTLEDE